MFNLGIASSLNGVFTSPLGYAKIDLSRLAHLFLASPIFWFSESNFRSKEHEYMELPWLTEARCRTEDPELFFPVGNTGPAVDQIEQAKSICRECKVSANCLEYAIKENQDSGIWGGLSEEERKSLKRRYARARRSA
jgi:WhiB family redox-sensing transcriptional regulator